MAGTYDIQLLTGEFCTRTFTLSDDNGLMDLSGFTARMQVRSSATDDEEVIALSVGGGGIVIEDATITINILSTDTDDINPGVYQYDLFYGPDAEHQTPLVQGRFVVGDAVTR